MKTRRKPYSTGEFFNIIRKRLEDEGRVPDCVEYATASREDLPIESYAFNVLGTVGYGGIEGIYLNLFCYGYLSEDDFGEMKRYDLGTFKSLNVTNEVFHKLASFMADFQIEASDFIRDNLEDFEWDGISIHLYKEGETECHFGRKIWNLKSLDDARVRAREEMQKYPEYVRAVIVRNKTGKAVELYA